MKKNLLITLFLSFLLCGCFGGQKAKCNNKEGLAILEGFIKDSISKQYDYQFGEHYEEEDEEIMKNINIVRKAQKEFKQYLNKEVKIEFSSFRTQAKDKLSRRCVAKVKLIFPEPPKSVQVIQEIYTKYNYWEGGAFHDYRFLDLSPIALGLQTIFNDTHEIDNVIYDITLTDDKKEVYAEFVNREAR